MGEQLKRCIPDYAIGNVNTNTLSYMFFASKCTSADLSSWTKITGELAKYIFCVNTRLQSINLENVEEIGGYGFQNGCYGCNSLIDVKLTKLKRVYDTYSMQYAFSGCKSLVNINLSNLESVTGQGGMAFCFGSCSILEYVDLSNLKIVGYSSLDSCFGYCPSFRELNLPELQEVGQNGCSSICNGQQGTSLKVVRLPKLTVCSTNAWASSFQYCSKLTEFHVNVAPLTNPNAANPLWSTTNVTDLYLYGDPINSINVSPCPLNIESVIRTLNYVADNTTVTDKILTFRSQTYKVTQDQKTRFDEAFDRVANTVENNGWHWTISGIKKENVTVDTSI